MQNAFYFNTINSIGGIETWLYNISQLFGDKYDINIFYRKADPKQLERLSKKAHCYQFFGQKIKCKKAILCYNTDIMDYIEADEYCQFLHGDYKALGRLPMLDKRITKYYSISEQVRKSFYELTGIDSEVIYNPIFLDEKKDVLKLISMTRLTAEKGKDRIIKMASELRKANIPFIWDIYTDDRFSINIDGIRYQKPRLDLQNVIKDYHYLCQLSSNEGYCYSIVESLINEIPVIATNMPVLREIGCNKDNSIILDFDLKNLNVYNVYDNRNNFNFDYQPPKSDFERVLEKGERNMKHFKVKSLIDYYDINAKVNRKINDIFEVDEQRYQYLKNHNAIELIGEIKETIKEEIKEEVKEVKKSKGRKNAKVS